MDGRLEEAAHERSPNERIHAAVRMHWYKLKEVGGRLGRRRTTIRAIARRMDGAC